MTPCNQILKLPIYPCLMPVESSTSLDRHSSSVSQSMMSTISATSHGSCIDSRQLHLNKSLYELLHSESIYIYYLQDLLDILTGPAHSNVKLMCKVHIKLLAALRSELSNTTLVRSLEQVHDRNHSSHFDFNSLDFCTEVDEANISAVFKTFIPFLKIYTEYIKIHYPVLSQKKEQHQLYIMPIQRIMRYSLLIAQILKYSLPCFISELESCLYEIQLVVSNINQSVHDSEALQQLVYYQKHSQHLPEPLLLPHQILKMQTTIYRISNISKDKRILLVLQDRLVWLKQVGPSKFSFRGQLKFPLNCQIGEILKEGPAKGHFSLIFICSSDQVTTLHQLCGSIVKYTFYTETKAQAELLLRNINDAIAKCQAYVK
eukprot:NODE_736_length_4706_cov_0.180161.p1 type:complete len:374 gc:universal NODE_736_length_4706_cov_0.180161:1702-2823(+)